MIEIRFSQRKQNNNETCRPFFFFVFSSSPLPPSPPPLPPSPPPLPPPMITIGVSPIGISVAQGYRRLGGLVGGGEGRRGRGMYYRHLNLDRVQSKCRRLSSHKCYTMAANVALCFSTDSKLMESWLVIDVGQRHTYTHTHTHSHTHTHGTHVRQHTLASFDRET